MSSAEKKKTILVVDDDPTLLTTTAALLSEDYDVLEATRGEDAMLLLSKGGIDMVCSDYRMPGISGVELLRQVAKRWPDTGCILITGQRDFFDTVKDYETGEFEVLFKPYDPNKLLQAVRFEFSRITLNQIISEKKKPRSTEPVRP